MCTPTHKHTLSSDISNYDLVQCVCITTHTNTHTYKHTHTPETCTYRQTPSGAFSSSGPVWSRWRLQFVMWTLLTGSVLHEWDAPLERSWVLSSRTGSSTPSPLLPFEFWLHVWWGGSVWPGTGLSWWWWWNHHLLLLLEEPCFHVEV